MSDNGLKAASAVLNHGMNLLAGSSRESINLAGKPYQVASRTIGDFTIAHTYHVERRGFELFDIFLANEKMLAMREEHLIDGWKLISIEPGEWQSAFLLTQI